MKLGKSLIKHILLVFKGALVGFGAIMPGISGGTLCVAFGMYQLLLNVLSHPIKTLKEDGLKIVVFGLGGVIGFIGLSGFAAWLMSVNSMAVTCAFIGFILGTLPELWHDAGKRGRNGFSYVSLIVGFVLLLALLLTLRYSEGINLSQGFLAYILCGILWGLSFVVPGLSSSTLIMFFGLYQPMLEGISNLSPKVIIPLGIGVLACIIALPKAINAAFRKWHSPFSHAIIGIVCASMLMVIPTEIFTSTKNVIVGGLYIIAGCAVSYTIGLITSSLNKKQN